MALAHVVGGQSDKEPVPAPGLVIEIIELFEIADTAADTLNRVVGVLDPHGPARPASELHQAPGPGRTSGPGVEVGFLVDLSGDPPPVESVFLGRLANGREILGQPDVDPLMEGRQVGVVEDFHLRVISVVNLGKPPGFPAMVEKLVHLRQEGVGPRADRPAQVLLFADGAGHHRLGVIPPVEHGDVAVGHRYLDLRFGHHPDQVLGGQVRMSRDLQVDPGLPELRQAIDVAGPRSDMDRFSGEVGRSGDRVIAPMDNDVLLNRHVSPGEGDRFPAGVGDGQAGGDEIPISPAKLGKHRLPPGRGVDGQLHAQVVGKSPGKVVLEAHGLTPVDVVAVGVVPGDHGDPAALDDPVEHRVPGQPISPGQKAERHRQEADGQIEQGRPAGRPYAGQAPPKRGPLLQKAPS